MKRFALICLVITIISGCAPNRSEVIQDHLAISSVLELVVFIEDQSLEDEIKKQVNQLIADTQRQIVILQRTYDVSNEEGKSIAKTLDIDQFPAFLLFNDEELVDEQYTFDDAIRSANDYYSEFRWFNNLNVPKDLKTEILEVRSNLPEDAGWWLVPKEVTSMTIFVEAKNADAVLFWIAPTGTETGERKELIDYDFDESDGWSFTWEFGDRSFHDHITIQALGIDGKSQDNQYINIVSVSDSSEQ